MRFSFLSLAALLVCSSALATEPKLVVTADPQSQPESVTVAPDGSLFLSSASMPLIYRAAKGAVPAQVFFDASADGNVSFLGVLADGPNNNLWACEIMGAGKDRHSILRSFDLTSAAPKFRLTSTSATTSSSGPIRRSMSAIRSAAESSASGRAPRSPSY
jgi:hypothetical protein